MYKPLDVHSHGTDSKSPLSLGFVDQRDITYFLRPIVEDVRVADGSLRAQHLEMTADLVLERGSEMLSQKPYNGHKAILIGGVPIFDDEIGIVRYEVKLVNGQAKDLKHLPNHGIKLMESYPNARMAESDFAIALASSEIPIGFTTEIVDYGGYYLVVARIIPDNDAHKTEVHKTLADIVQRRSIHPGGRVH